MSIPELQKFLLTKKTCKIDTGTSLAKFFGFSSPENEFKIEKFRAISELWQRNIVVIQSKKNVYKVKPKYEKTITLKIRPDCDPDETLEDFDVIFNHDEKSHSCKTKNCFYSTTHKPTLQRHEKSCTGEQKIVDQQIAYGEDKTPILELVNLGYLPVEALNFRKSYITTYDIETVECKDGIDELKNVEAIHKIASIACSTNRGDTKCFVREDSSHESAAQIFDDFLGFLDDLNANHDDELPNYFHEGLELLDLMMSRESILPRKHKMELLKLKKCLEKYMLQDVFGFNSCEFL